MTEITSLAQSIRAMSQDGGRILVAIVGAPGSGKSTLSKTLADQIGASAAILPMDGFHLDNSALEQLGLLHRKGAPETFDVAGLDTVLRAVRARPSVRYPTFDRAADKTVPDAGHIEADTSIVLVEGNYLLLDRPGWSDLAALFDLTVALEVSRVELESRLIQRWRDHGLPQDQARARARDNDMKNADFMTKHSRPADITITNSA